jgi:hypothetical protein
MLRWGGNGGHGREQAGPDLPGVDVGAQQGNANLICVSYSFSSINANFFYVTYELHGVIIYVSYFHSRYSTRATSLSTSKKIEEKQEQWKGSSGVL